MVKHRRKRARGARTATAQPEGGPGGGSRHAGERFKAQRLRKNLHQKVQAGKLLRKHEAKEQRKMASLLASVGLSLPGFPPAAGGAGAAQGAQAARLTGGSRKAVRCQGCTRPLRDGRCRKCLS